MFRVGNLTTASSLVLAPMAGITDLPFRLISRSYGCELAFAEMISAQSLVEHSRRTRRMMTSLSVDKPLGMQLLGNDEDVIKRAVEAVNEFHCAVLDFNAACPVSKVTKKGEGSSLLKEPKRLQKILKAMVMHAACPVTVKIRAGWDDTTVNAKDVARHAREAGISGLFLHGRTRVQGYGGTVDYRIIQEVKDVLDIPVIASGDALSPPLIKRMFDETGCDAVAVARGALGNPWIFRESEAYLDTGVIKPRPSLDEITGTMLRHLELNCCFYGERRGVTLFRKLFPWYVKGRREIRPLKEAAFKADTKEKMTKLIESAGQYEYNGPSGVYEGPRLSCC